VTNTADVPTFGVKATICTSAAVPDDVIYTVTKEVFENIEELRKLHPALAVLTRENMMQGLSAPLHPGAIKYFKEVGLIK
jgi:TRAP transporter TAXI family solute receptor